MDGKRRIAIVATAAGASAAAGYAAMRALRRPKTSRSTRRETTRTTVRKTPHRKKTELTISATSSNNRRPTHRTKSIST